MLAKNKKFSSNQKIALAIILSLVVVNAVWIISFSFLGPVIALICYLFVTFLFLKKYDFRAGIIIGIMGLAVHIYELIFQGISELKGVEILFFITNLVFPIALIYFSYKACKELKL